MFCKNCGASMGDFDTTCPNCGANYGGASYPNFGESNKEPIKTTGLLVWSIIELLCVNMIAGIIALILWCTKLKPAADNGDVVAANKAKKPIKIVLWAGLIFTIILSFILALLIAVPNFSGIQDRMAVRADKATAAQIGKAVRVWYTDATYSTLGFDVEEVENDFVRLDEIDGIENYIIDSKPTSYMWGKGESEDGAYYVTMIDEDEPSQSRIVVAIGPEDLNEVPRSDRNFYKTFEKNLDGIDSSDVTYDGSGSGIAYLEYSSDSSTEYID